MASPKARAATAEPASWGELVASYARNRDEPMRREALQTACGRDQRRQKIPGVNDRNPILNEFKSEIRERARQQNELKETQKWEHKRAETTARSSRSFDIVSNRFVGFTTPDPVVNKSGGGSLPLVSVHAEQHGGDGRLDKPRHKTDYNIIAPTTDPNAKRKEFVMPFKSMARREFDMLSNKYIADNEAKMEQDQRAAEIKGTRNPMAYQTVLGQYYNPETEAEITRRAAEAERAARKRAADLKPPFMQKGVSRLYNITSQDVIKDPVAYATQQVEWARQERIFRDRYTRGAAIKAASDAADVLHVTQAHNRMREERTARVTDYDIVNLRDYALDPPADGCTMPRATNAEVMGFDQYHHQYQQQPHHTDHDEHDQSGAAALTNYESPIVSPVASPVASPVSGKFFSSARAARSQPFTPQRVPDSPSHSLPALRAASGYGNTTANGSGSPTAAAAHSGGARHGAHLNAYPLGAPAGTQFATTKSFEQAEDRLPHRAPRLDGAEAHLPTYLQKIRIQTSKVAGVQPAFTRPHSAARVLGSTMTSSLDF